jgi:hypothetical protein
MSMSPTTSFWKRFGLREEDRLRCLQIVQDRYIGCEVREFGEQGYCSFTLVVSGSHGCSAANDSIEGSYDDIHTKRRKTCVVQIRPTQHALDLEIAHAAKKTYPSLAPSIRILDLKSPNRLRGYEMQEMPGTPLSRILLQYQVLDSSLRERQEQLVTSFAAVIAQGWLAHSEGGLKSRTTRADSPMEEMSDMLSECTGRVGSSIRSKLEKLNNELPDSLLRDKAKATLDRVQHMENYPVVMNHGDLIPSNILVHEDTWAITGLIDWAEAEYLPFGTCLYGLEHLLGYISPSVETFSPTGLTSSASYRPPMFVYCHLAAQLRALFWSRLFETIPELELRQDDVGAMRDLGVLLWYGYAWDDGAIDRVVNEEDDEVEVACLREFLGLKT